MIHNRKITPYGIIDWNFVEMEPGRGCVAVKTLEGHLALSTPLGPSGIQLQSPSTSERTIKAEHVKNSTPGRSGSRAFVALPLPLFANGHICLLPPSLSFSRGGVPFRGREPSWVEWRRGMIDKLDQTSTSKVVVRLFLLNRRKKEGK
jgi:hypothetical protein